jgi:hypothetical protein
MMIKRADLKRDDGAFAVMFAIVLVLVVAVAAIAIDLAMFNFRKQELVNINDAAALAGAQKLPNLADAQIAVDKSLLANGGSKTGLTANYYCIVGSELQGGVYVPKASEIATAPNQAGTLCYPGGVGYVPQCDSTTCAVPCIGPLCTPNALRVGQNRSVDFAFAPVIGILRGETEVVSAVACKGTCGVPGTNPMDIVVIADRTGSMSTAERNLEIAAIKNMLSSMEPSIQRVALSAVGWSTGSGTCRSAAYGSDPSASNNNVARWMPVALSSNFGGKAGLVTSSSIVSNVNCLNQSGTGTWLAAPTRVAARYLLEMETGITGGAALQDGATKAIIFETDGEPNENNVGTAVSAGAAALNTSNNVGSSNTSTSCTNFTRVIQAAQAQGVLVAFIDFHTGTLSGACDLQALASTEPNSSAKMHYVASDAAQLNSLYQTALNAISGKSRLIKLPPAP